MSTLLNIVNSLQSFSDNLQNTLSNRLANIQSKVFNAKDSNGNNIFSQSLLNKITAISNQYKVKFGNQNVSDNIAIGQQGNRLLFNSSNLYPNEDYFTNLQTLDIYKVISQGTHLRGLLGSTEPVLPMVFNVVYPETAQSLVGNSAVQNPLYLFVNPSSWQRTSAKVLAKNYIRNGIKTERWGEELEQITASGTTAAFFTQETGLTRFFRNQTPGFRNLLELLQVYRNNGCIYGQSYQGFDGAPTAFNKILDVGFVEILYGYELFRGTFETFSITENASKPHNLEYSFTFQCSQVISIHDMLTQSSEFSNSTEINIQDGTFTPQEIIELQQQITGNNSTQALQANSVNSQNALNPTNVDKNKGNAKPILKLGN